ncbi:MAG TPA: hypothetical protein VIL60_08560 [Rhodanobacter sp.]
MTKAPDQRGTRSTTFRVVTGAFGLLFVAIGLVILVVAERSLGAGVAALVVGGLGVEALAAAIHNRRSLLERIGPLP